MYYKSNINYFIVLIQVFNKLLQFPAHVDKRSGTKSVSSCMVFLADFKGGEGEF